MEVKPPPHETDAGSGGAFEKFDVLLLLCVVGFAVVVALADFVIVESPLDAEIARARRLQPYVSSAECWRPLNAYCKDRPCITYENAVAVMEQFRTPGGHTAVAGICGEFRYTYETDSHFGERRFFDVAGELVAVHTTTDGRRVNVECPRWTHYGPLIKVSAESGSRLLRSAPS